MSIGFRAFCVFYKNRRAKLCRILAVFAQGGNGRRIPRRCLSAECRPRKKPGVPRISLRSGHFAAEGLLLCKLLGFFWRF